MNFFVSPHEANMPQHFIIRISLSCHHRIHLQPLQSLTQLKLKLEAKLKGIGGKEEKRMLETCAKLACTSLHLQHHAQLKIKITSAFSVLAFSFNLKLQYQLKLKDAYVNVVPTNLCSRKRNGNIYIYICLPLFFLM